MALLSIAELGRAANVSRQAASKWVKDWKVPLLSDAKGHKGVDGNHPDVAAYIAKGSMQRCTAGRARASTGPLTDPQPGEPAGPRRPAKTEVSSPPSNGQSAGADRIPAGLEVGGDALNGHEKRSRGRHISKSEGPARSDYVARKEKALAEKHELGNRILRHDYVPIKDLRAIFGKFYAVHTGIIQPLGAKLAAQIAAEYGVTDPAKTLRVQEIIDKDAYPALTTIKREMDDFLEAQRERIVSEEEELALESEDDE